MHIMGTITDGTYALDVYKWIQYLAIGVLRQYTRNHELSLVDLVNVHNGLMI